MLHHPAIPLPQSPGRAGTKRDPWLPVMQHLRGSAWRPAQQHQELLIEEVVVGESLEELRERNTALEQLWMEIPLSPNALAYPQPSTKPGSRSGVAGSPLPGLPSLAGDLLPIIIIMSRARSTVKRCKAGRFQQSLTDQKSRSQ